jgi:site-specific DNA-methyltransferase (adenine-specific)
MNITKEVMEVTGITPEALARKLRVLPEDILAWKAGTRKPQALAHSILDEMYARTKKPLPQDGPRVSKPYVESQFLCADSLECLSEIPDESIDFILSDIPYGIGLQGWDVLHANTNSAYLGSSAAQQRSGKVFDRRRKPINGWSAADANISTQYYDWCKSWGPEWLRVLKPGGSAIVFAGRRLAHRCVGALEDVGFNYRDMLCWIRPKSVLRAQRLSTVYKKRGDLAEANRWKGWRVGNLRPSFEPILWCFKPYAVTIADNMLDHHLGAMNIDRFQELTGGVDNILKFGFQRNEGGLHQAQKPVALLKTLIELCTVEGQIVLDPFAGSGSTAVAALETKRRYYAVEREPETYAVAQDRINTLLKKQKAQ